MSDVSSAGTSTNGFIFADLRDYSRYVETHGDVAAAGLLTACRSLVPQVVLQHEGAEIKTEGDSLYVVFSSATGAVRFAMDILGVARDAAAEPIDHSTHGRRDIRHRSGPLNTARAMRLGRKNGRRAKYCVLAPARRPSPASTVDSPAMSPGQDWDDRP
jgi:class 3 adenylate cyclase